MKTNTYQSNYRTNARKVQLKIDAASAERKIPANDSVRLLDQTVEEMDVSSLWSTYKRTGRKPATNPVAMLKLLLYANMEGIYSSRDIESACKRDLNFIWLLNGAKGPIYHEIARFRSKRLTECGEALFYQLLKNLAGVGEICFEHLFVDGTKIEANANKHSFVWKKSTTKNEMRVPEKLDAAFTELSSKYALLVPEAEELLPKLEARMTGAYAHGRGKRKSQLQRDIEALRELLARRDKCANYQRPLPFYVV